MCSFDNLRTPVLTHSTKGVNTLLRRQSDGSVCALSATSSTIHLITLNALGELVGLRRIPSDMGGLTWTTEPQWALSDSVLLLVTRPYWKGKNLNWIDIASGKCLMSQQVACTDSGVLFM